MMNVLIADKLSSQAVESLEQLGFQVSMRPELSADELPVHMAGVHILVVRSTKVTEAAIACGNADSLGLIIRAGSGVNTIDVACASRHGVHVANCPGKNANAVAELTIGLLVAADRRIADACGDLRAGKWRKKLYGQAHGLKGRRLGLLGFGAIGQAVCRAARGLEMDVLAWSRSLTEELAELHDAECASGPEEIAATCDALSIHLPFCDATKHLVNAAFLDRLRDGAILINTSRGELVDTAALLEAIPRKGLRVALDVYEDEPAGGDAEFSQTGLAEIITGTPHMGASTAQTDEAIADEVVRIARQYRDTGKPPGSVNLCQRSPATHQLVVRHANRIGVLASILDGLRAEQINVEEMENMIFEGALAASCTLRLDGAPSEALLSEWRANALILQVSVSV